MYYELPLQKTQKLQLAQIVTACLLTTMHLFEHINLISGKSTGYLFASGFALRHRT